jgi:tRNA pseudouridine38-40 synthase
MRVALGVEYDGRAFKGWQRLGEGRRTIQPVVENALAAIANHPVRIHCAGRTDAGVHALGQVIHLDTEARRDERAWVLGANTHLPNDVGITWARSVPATFHARHSAISRVYRYVICNRRERPAVTAAMVTWYHQPLTIEPMRLAARDLLGEHDFSAFRAAECQSRTPVRRVDRLDVWAKGTLVIVEVEANAFLQHMVRNLVGVLMAIGSGKAKPTWAREVLESRDRRLGGVTAPADGLYLVEVRYPESCGLPRPRRDLLPG